MSANKRSSTVLCLKTDVSKSENRKRDEDNFFLAYFSNEIKDVMSALYRIKEKAEKNSLMKMKEDTISSVVSEIKSMLDMLKSTIEKERQTFAKAVSKRPIECEKSLKMEIATFQGLNERFCNKKAAKLQALEDTISNFEAEKERLVKLYEKLMERPGFIYCVLKLQRERSPLLTLLAPRQTFRAPCVLQREIEPFILSHSSRRPFYVLNFRDGQRNRHVKFSEKIDISKWKIVSHNATSGWIMLVNKYTVAFYHVVQHRVFVVMEKTTPYNFGSNCKFLQGCFSGDPESDHNMIMLVLRLKRKLRVFRYSAALASWIQPTDIAVNLGHTPFGHIQVGGNFMWVDQRSNNLFIISNWEDLQNLNVRVASLPADYPHFPVTTAKIGRDIYFITFRNAIDPVLDVLLAIFSENGELRFETVNGFKGFNVYAEFGGTGIGCVGTGIDRMRTDDDDGHYITHKNVLYLSGVANNHCTRYVNFNNFISEDQLKCYDPRFVNEKEVAEAAVGTGFKFGAWADDDPVYDEDDSESDDEDDPGVCLDHVR